MDIVFCSIMLLLFLTMFVFDVLFGNVAEAFISFLSASIWLWLLIDALNNDFRFQLEETTQ